MKLEVQIDSQIYTVEIEDIHARPVIARVQGERFEVWPEVSAPIAPEQAFVPVTSVPDATPSVSAPAAPAGAANVADVTSPLPGVIVAILVKPGDAVTRGQELCTLEAMKMKNAIRSSREGVIQSVEINLGDRVNHGQLLITFAE